VREEQANLREQSSGLMAQWRNEKAVIDQVRSAQEKIETLKGEAERAQRIGDLTRRRRSPTAICRMANRALGSREGPTLVLRKTARCSRRKSPRRTSPRRFLMDRHPREPLQEGEKQKLVRMEERLGARVVGQKKAITAVSNAVRRARAGLQDENRPIGSFLFLGPTGVGKTELSKALAEFLFDDEAR
jgi:ATP-dependent Clp protease ATP-binding subunit ClpB